MTEEKKVDIVDAADTPAITENKDKETLEQLAARMNIHVGLVKLYLYAAQMFEGTSVNIELIHTHTLCLHFASGIRIDISRARGAYFVSILKGTKYIVSRRYRMTMRLHDEVIGIIEGYAKKYM